MRRTRRESPDWWKSVPASSSTLYECSLSLSLSLSDISIQVKILAGSFTGATLYENPNYISPNKLRRMQKSRKDGRYAARVQAKESREEKKEKLAVEPSELDELFRK